MNSCQKMKKTAAIYARVSSQKQKEEETIESQKNVLLTYANEHEYEVPSDWVFLDDGVSGTELKREALDILRDMIRTEPIKTLLVYAPDRLSRKYSHQLILQEEFQKYGVDIYFLKSGPQNDTPEGRMFTQIQGIFAEYERELIIDRSRRGRIYKAKQGDASALSCLPFGYRRVREDKKMSIQLDSSKAEIVKEIYKLYIYEKVSMLEIARLLTAKGIPSPSGQDTWSRITIRRILMSTAYIGTAYVGRTTRGKHSSNIIRHYGPKKIIGTKSPRKVCPKEEWLPIDTPQIISESDFEAAQERLRLNKKHSQRNTKEAGLLQGLLICGECGYPFYKRSRNLSKGKVGYYLCRSHYHSELKKCGNNSVKQKELDDAVYTKVLDLLNNPHLIEQELLRRAEAASNVEEISRNTINLKKELSKVSKEKDRLLDAFQQGLLNLEELQNRSTCVDKRVKIIQKELEGIQAASFQNQMSGKILDSCNMLLNRMRAASDNLAVEEKQQLIRLLVEKVVVSKDSIKIVHCISQKMLDPEEMSQLRYDALSIHTAPVV